MNVLKFARGKGLLTAVLSVFCLITFSVCGETIAWYRFNEGTLGSRVGSSVDVQNAANPGTLTGHCHQIATDGSIDDTDTGFMPTSDASISEVLGLYNPQAASKYANGRSFFFKTSIWDANHNVSGTADSGVGSCVTVPYDNALELTGSFTVECFFKSALANNQAAGFQTIIALRNNATSVGRYSYHIFTHNEGSVGAQVISDSGELTFNVSGKVNAHDGKWHHVAITVYSSGQGTYSYKLFFDYAQVGATKNTATAVYYNPEAALPLAIGCTPGHENRRWVGWIDDVRISTGYNPVNFLRPAAWMADNMADGTMCQVSFVNVTNTFGRATYCDSLAWMTNTDFNCAGTASSAYVRWDASSMPAVFDDVVRPAATLYGDSFVGGTWSRKTFENAFSLHQATNIAGHAASLLVDDRVNNAHTVLNGSFTLEVFVRKDERPHSEGCYVMHQGKTISSAWLLALYVRNNDKLEFHAGKRGDADSISNVNFANYSGFSDGKWHHVAVTYNRETQTMEAWIDYKNIGTLENYDFPYDLANAPLQVGGGYGETSALKLNGWIDEFRMSNKVLRRGEFLTSVPKDHGIIVIVE